MKRILVSGFTNSLAGTEAVIANIVGALEGEVAFDFLVFEEPTNYPQLFKGANRYFVLPNKRTRLVAYFRAIEKHFSNYAHEYDAVWSNLNILNNVDSLRLGKKYGISRRILHAHNSRKDGKIHQRLLCALHKGSVAKYVTDRWACSRAAGEFFFGDMDYVFVPNAIDMGMYAYDPSARSRIREELGIGEDLVIGTVGRLTFQKGQDLLVCILPAVLSEKPAAMLVIIGEGELKDGLRSLAMELGVADHVLFLGSRSDIPACLSAFDVFALPSLFEGLPVSLVEAQANGLPCVVSDCISDEAVFTKCVQKASRDNAGLWAHAILESQRHESAGLPEEAMVFDLRRQSIMLKELFS